MYYIEIVAVVLCPAPALSCGKESCDLAIPIFIKFCERVARGLATIPGVDFHAGLQM